ncbi:MAG: hypothetical protein IKD20_06135 [Clostridia bacterium]|nr:hypothetical protein [Clostridia bacterium]
MNEYELSKLFDRFDGAVNLSDFSEEELLALRDSMRGEEEELTDNQKLLNFKEDYFAYYDDVKDHTKGREDW